MPIQNNLSTTFKRMCLNTIPFYSILFCPLCFHTVCVSLSATAKVQFNWRDALELDGQLTEEEVMIRDSFRDYCQDKLMPRILMANRHERKAAHGYLKPPSNNYLPLR